MMEIARDTSVPFGGLSTQHECVNSPSLARSLVATDRFHLTATITGKTAVTFCPQNCRGRGMFAVMQF